MNFIIMKKFTFVLFLTFMSVMTIHANVLIGTFRSVQVL